MEDVDLLSWFIANHLNKIEPNAHTKLSKDWAKNWGVFTYPRGNQIEKTALTLVCVGFGIQKLLNNNV